MNRQNNRHLVGYETCFAGFGVTESPRFWWDDGKEHVGLSGLQASVILRIALQATASRNVRVLIVAKLEDLPREWFAEALTGGNAEWQMESYNHESRTAVYTNGVRKIALSHSANWLACSDAVVALNAYRNANSNFERVFGFPFLASPTMTGLYAIEQSLPQKIETQPLPSEFAEHLHQHTTQGRSEFFGEAMTDKFYYFDRVFAYAADCYLEMPCGVPFYEKLGEFKRFEAAFYQVKFEVPENWQHVGLLPVMSVDGWRWPRSGKHETFVAEPELRLAAENGWRFEVVEKWSFGVGRPLESWRKKLVQLWDSAKIAANAGCVELRECRKAESDIYRRILLHGLGGLYARSFRRERIVTAEQMAEENSLEALTAEPLGESFRMDTRVARSDRHYMPHWTAYTWSRARRNLALQMLSLPFSSVLACHVDAIYSREPLADEGTAIGKFRLKGKLEFPEEKLVTSRELLRWRQLSEGGDV